MEAQKRLNNLHQILSRSLEFQPALSSLPSSQTSLSPSATASSVEVQTITPCHGCSLTVTPAVGQFDQPVRIWVGGLPSHTKVTLQGWSRCQWRGTEVLLVSHGHFYTDEQGNLDLDMDPSLGGTYTGVDPMGLFWSMAPLPNQPQDVHLVIRDVTKPLVINIAVFDGHITPSDGTVAMMSLKPMCITEVQRTFLAPGVRRIEIREGRVRGTLFLPPGEGAHPGVIDMFGAAGGIMEIRAALLAAHGFAAMALAFFNFEDLPKELNDLRLEYFQEAVEWLSSHPSAQPTGIGVVGVSTGGSQALLMAMICPQVKAVVEINGRPYQVLYDLILNGRVLQQGVPIGSRRVTHRAGDSVEELSGGTGRQWRRGAVWRHWGQCSGAVRHGGSSRGPDHRASPTLMADLQQLQQQDPVLTASTAKPSNMKKRSTWALVQQYPRQFLKNGILRCGQADQPHGAL